MEGRGAHGVGGDFVFHDRRAHDGTDQPPGAAGGPDADDLPGFRVKLLFQQAQQLFDGPDGIALRPDILLRQDGVAFVQDHGFGGDGPHVDAEESVLFAQGFTFFLISTMS